MSQITLPREELEQVLEALEKPHAGLVPHNGEWTSIQAVAISTLRARLAEQRPEPVAFRYRFGLTDTLVQIRGDMTHMLKQCTIDRIGGGVKYGEVTWLYASPPPRSELSEEEMRECFASTNTREPLEEGWPGLLRFGRAIERKVRNV